MSGKYIFRTAELGYRTQKNISLAFLRCIGVNVDECSGVKDIFVYRMEKIILEKHKIDAHKRNASQIEILQ